MSWSMVEVFRAKLRVKNGETSVNPVLSKLLFRVKMSRSSLHCGWTWSAWVS